MKRIFALQSGRKRVHLSLKKVQGEVIPVATVNGKSTDYDSFNEACSKLAEELRSLYGSIAEWRSMCQCLQLIQQQDWDTLYDTLDT